MNTVLKHIIVQCFHWFIIWLATSLKNGKSFIEQIDFGCAINIRRLYTPCSVPAAAWKDSGLNIMHVV